MKLYGLSFGFGLVSGSSLAWCLSVIMRALHGQQSLLGLAEFWLSLILLLTITALASALLFPMIRQDRQTFAASLAAPAPPNANMPSLTPASSSLSSKLPLRLRVIKLYLALSLGMSLGVGLVLLWGVQTMIQFQEDQTDALVSRVALFASPLLQAHPFATLPGGAIAPENPETATPEQIQSWCALSKSLWSEVLSKPMERDLGVYEKSVIKDLYAQSFALGCLSDRDYFDLVENLRYRTTALPSSSSMLSWDFSPARDDHAIAQKLLVVTKKQWCLASYQAHLWREKKVWVPHADTHACQSLNDADQALTRPIDLSDLFSTSSL